MITYSNGYEKTIYQENTYLIEKKGPGWYRFIHRCQDNPRETTIWMDNERKLESCSYCHIAIPPHMIFLWEMIDKNFP